MLTNEYHRMEALYKTDKSENPRNLISPDDESVALSRPIIDSGRNLRGRRYLAEN